MKKGACCFILSLVLLMSALTACSSGSASGSGSNTAQSNSGSESASASSDDVLYQVYESLPYITLDPSVEYSNGIIILQNVYETLTHYNSETGELDPMLATEWSCNEDGTEWTFKLREGVTFHDGTPFTSAEVKASLERTISLGQGAAYMWDAVEDIETNGDYEVTIICSSPSPIDLISSAGYASYIMSAASAEQDAEWFNEGNDGGTGPYYIDQVTKDTVILKGYDDYYRGWSDDQFKNVLVKEVSESSARRQMLETGEAQFSGAFSNTDLEALKENDSLYIYQADAWQNCIVFLNTQKYPCDNAEFRKALQYAFPYDETVDVIMAGNALRSYGMIPRGLWAHDESLFQYTEDLDKAKECLDASGVDVDGLSLEVTYASPFSEYSSALQLWQENLRELGITIDLRGMEWDAQWEESMATDPNDRQDVLIMRWWADYASPASWFDSLVLSEDEVSFNLAYINDPELDEMVMEATAYAVTDRDKAEEIYIEIQKKLLEDAPLIFAFDDIDTFVVSKTISGVYENPAYPTVVSYYDITKNN